jgi:membrane protein
MKSFLNQTKNRTAEFFQLLSKYISQGEINQTSIIIAYYVLLSIFPIIIIIGNVLPYLVLIQSQLLAILN